LGQIDPAVTEERLVERLHQRQSELSSDWQAAPLKYWEQWHEECQLADRIVVNSEWSRKALEKEGISAGKIRVVPLAYAPPPEAAGFRREYPAQFTSERPLRILFLGQINLRKGIGPLLEAAEMLRGEPVEFHIVGPVLVTVPEKWRRHPQIRWLGPVPRGAVAEHYRAADVFLFPTFSDGFGMTQLEAQAWQLPIVASQFCGDVVRDGVNGLRLTEVNAGGIAQAVRRFLASPEQLAAMSRASGVGAEFSLSGIAATLESVLD
jgi:glycosyltransferase involved in cell wall biosynthesis